MQRLFKDFEDFWIHYGSWYFYAVFCIHFKALKLQLPLVVTTRFHYFFDC